MMTFLLWIYKIYVCYNKRGYIDDFVHLYSLFLQYKHLTRSLYLKENRYKYKIYTKKLAYIYIYNGIRINCEYKFEKYSIHNLE